MAAAVGSGSTLLQIDDVSLEFGGIKALDAVGFDVPAGEICAVIGPNGAGKTSLFNVVTGLYKASSGQVRLEGQDLLHKRRHQLAGLGISRTFQNLGLIEGLSALENVMLGGHAGSSGGFAAGILRLPRFLRSEKALEQRALELMDACGVVEIAERGIDGLPYGTLKRLELARALMNRPRLLLLDEPAAGLAEEEVRGMVALLRDLSTSSGMTLVLVEHHMEMVMELSHRVVVLNFGRKIADGEPQAVAADPAVIEAYLGAGVAR
jgi:branched-chain amino acid transport system ATP-binding protein